MSNSKENWQLIKIAIFYIIKIIVYFYKNKDDNIHKTANNYDVSHS